MTEVRRRPPPVRGELVVVYTQRPGEVLTAHEVRYQSDRFYELGATDDEGRDLTNFTVRIS